MSSIDHIADCIDPADGDWVAVTTTAGGLQFVVDAGNRAMLGLDAASAVAR